ncbi:MAG: hypothetical protein QOI41_7745 [Myxococcales bacterium]|nr:hypothetical protein [Myxococcales bacterium]
MRRPTETRLRRAFADVLTALLATSAGAMAVAGAAGCGGGSTTADSSLGGDGGAGGGGGDGGVTPPPAGFTSFCSQGSPIAQRSFLQGLTASPALDGAVTRTEQAFTRRTTQNGVTNPPMDELGDAWSATNGEQVGSLCSKAQNPTACRDKVAGYRMLPTSRDACVAQYPSYSYAPTECGASYILYTRGDEIAVARTKEETKALIGTFDTVEEAVWAAQTAQASNLQVTCGSSYGGSTPDSGWRQTADGGWDLSLTEQNCGMESYQVVVHVDYAGNVTEVSRVDLNMQTGCAVAGRRPEGLRLDSAVRAGKNAAGEHFASMATLEAASVVAFRRLHRQLAAYGAPRELLERIRKAARDEVRHARATGILAKKYGVTPAAPQLGACDESPSLFAIALENAREGCVRETYGALVAHLQTTRAGDADVRACMAAIADEETEHAALSWDIAAWIEAQLDEEQRAHLAAERRDAFATLARDVAVPVNAQVARISGIPSACDALRMLEGLEPMMLAA